MQIKRYSRMRQLLRQRSQQNIIPFKKLLHSDVNVNSASNEHRINWPTHSCNSIFEKKGSVHMNTFTRSCKCIIVFSHSPKVFSTAGQERWLVPFFTRKKYPPIFVKCRNSSKGSDKINGRECGGSSPRFVQLNEEADPETSRKAGMQVRGKAEVGGTEYGGSRKFGTNLLRASRANERKSDESAMKVKAQVRPEQTSAVRVIY